MNPYYYNSQIKKRITTFMAIFAGLQVETGKRSDGETKLLNVPIRYGDVDRVVAWIKSEATQNKMIKLPLMSSVYTEIRLDESLRKGISTERSSSHLPLGGAFPEDIKVVNQLMPIPYRLYIDLDIYSSNNEQQLQILEQILVLFDPTLILQTGDALFDWTKLSAVTLENIGLESNYPIGTERNIRKVKLSFSMPIYISIPAQVKNDFIKDIYVRIGAINNSSNTSEEIITDLDSDGINYEKWFSTDNINFDL